MPARSLPEVISLIGLYAPAMAKEPIDDDGRPDDGPLGLDIHADLLGAW